MSLEGNSVFRRDESERKTAGKIRAIVDMINQSVGDALSDMLLVETILHEKGWDLRDWERCYQNLPCKQLKVKVKDRSVITTTDADRKCVTPEGLQTRIDELVSQYSKGRCFVRCEYALKLFIIVQEFIPFYLDSGNCVIFKESKVRVINVFRFPKFQGFERIQKISTMSTF